MNGTLGDDGSFAARVDFAPCVLGRTGGTLAAKVPAECADVELPLRWDGASDREQRVHVFVKRVKGARVTTEPLRTGPRAHASVWLLATSPGGAGVEMEPLALELTRRDPTLTVYVGDVRGSGQSTRLECTEEEDARSPGGIAITDSEWHACLSKLKTQWGDRLTAFTTENMARDFSTIADAVVPPGERLFLYGRGYGSYLASRMIDVSKRPISGVAHDGPCLPGTCFLSRDEAMYTDAGRALLDACGRDDLCRKKLGADPWTRVGEALDVVEARSCAPLAELGLDRLTLRTLFARYLLDWEKRALIPALTYRILRCGPSDRAALTRFANDLTGPLRVDAASLEASQVLAAHVTLSELWQPGATVSALTEEADGSYFATGAGPELAHLRDEWPRYTDPRAQAWPAHMPPTVVFTGPLDPEIEVDDATRAKLDASVSTVLSFGPSAGGAALGSPTRAGPSCGLDVLTSFFYDPDHADYGCLTEQLPVSFDGGSELAEQTFGTRDLWE